MGGKKTRDLIPKDDDIEEYFSNFSLREIDCAILSDSKPSKGNFNRVHGCHCSSVEGKVSLQARLESAAPKMTVALMNNQGAVLPGSVTC